MRVCLVSREVAPFYGGGIGTYTDQMARTLTDAGHEVHILTQDHEGLRDSAPELRPDFHYHTVDMGQFPLNLRAYPSYAQRHAMGAFHLLTALHEDLKFDYIELPDYWGDGYFALRAKRLTGAFDDTVLGLRLHSPAWALRKYDVQPWVTTDMAICDHLEQTSIQLADVLLSASQAMFDEADERLAGRLPSAQDCPRHIVPLPMCVESLQETLGGTDHADDATAWDAPEGRKKVLLYGRLQHLKGVHTLVEAGVELLASGEDVEFRILGQDTDTAPLNGSIRKWLDRKVGPWRDRFIFEPRRPRDELGQLIRSADVVCVPSLFESFSMVTVEALAMGACVVGSRGSAIEEIITDGEHGLLFEVGNASDLASTLRTALNDPELRARVGANAPARVRELCEPATIASDLERIVHETRANNEKKKAALDARLTAERAADAATGEPLVTVAIPFYNLGKYLQETIQSVRAQTFTDYEILVVDDGSTDADSLRLLDDLGSHQDIRIHRKPNGGLSSARNAGMREARGKYVMLLDADDVLHPDYLAKTVEAIRREPNAAVACSLTLIFEETPDKPVNGWIPLGIDHDLMPFLCVGATASCLVDKEKIQAIGGYDERLPTGGEDWDMWMNCAANNYEAAVVPEFLFLYRGRADGMFHTDVLPRLAQIKAYLLFKYPQVAHHADYPMRLQLAETEHFRKQTVQLQNSVQHLKRQLHQAQQAQAGLQNGTLQVEVNRVIAENIRYRLVDRVNNALKATKLQTPIKKLTGGALKAAKRASNR